MFDLVMNARRHPPVEAGFRACRDPDPLSGFRLEPSPEKADVDGMRVPQPFDGIPGIEVFDRKRQIRPLVQCDFGGVISG